MGVTLFMKRGVSINDFVGDPCPILVFACARSAGTDNRTKVCINYELILSILAKLSNYLF